MMPDKVEYFMLIFKTIDEIINANKSELKEAYMDVVEKFYQEHDAIWNLKQADLADCMAKITIWLNEFGFMKSTELSHEARIELVNQKISSLETLKKIKEMIDSPEKYLWTLRKHDSAIFTGSQASDSYVMPIQREKTELDDLMSFVFPQDDTSGLVKMLMDKLDISESLKTNFFKCLERMDKNKESALLEECKSAGYNQVVLAKVFGAVDSNEYLALGTLVKQGYSQNWKIYVMPYNFCMDLKKSVLSFWIAARLSIKGNVCKC